ncbi:MAG: hypothetical protein OSA99_18015 [Acidimicrobiales bacterium]|nr:hypothetical protein [Acidimicrobiales bacterium]
MLSSIHPLGERAKNNRFGLTAALFALGSVAGGATTGVVIGIAGLAADAVSSPDAAVLSAAIVVFAAGIVEWRGAALPSLRRQVDEDWLTRYRRWVYATGFGFQLGAGVLTYITSAGVFAALGCALFVGHPAGAMAIMATFGLTRGLSLVAARSITTPDRLRAFFRRLHATAPSAKRVSWITLVAVAVATPATLL